MTTQDHNPTSRERAVAAAMQGFYNCHGDEKRWEPWEFEAEQKLLDMVRDRFDHEDRK